MDTFAKLISDLVADGVDPDLIGRVASFIAVANNQSLDISLSAPEHEEFLEDVAAKHGCSVKDLRSKCRVRQFVRARHEAFYGLYYERNVTMPDIGKMFGNRDHTTVLHGIREHKKRLSNGALQ